MSQAPALPQWSQMCRQFMTKLHEIQHAGCFCDLTFELKTQKFNAHKVVISAWSPLIYKLLGDGYSVQETIQVQYDNTEVFGSFLAFLYSSKMDEVAEHNLVQILHLATSLQVNHLRQVCEEMLKEQLNISNIISTFHLARKYRLPNLEEYTMNNLQMHLPEAVKQADFLSLSPPRFNSFLSSGWVCVMKPEVKLFLIISWLGYDVKERQQYLVLLLKYIDWSSVANDFLSEISQTENFFTTNESSLYLLLQTLFSSMIPLGPYVDRFPALREKYAYLLDHIVQNSFVFPLEVDDFSPVPVHLVSSSQNRPSTFAISKSGADVEAASQSQLTEGAVGSDQTSLDYSDTQDLSNDSVLAGIGLRMKNVAIAETPAVCSDKVMLSGHMASGFDDEQNHANTLRDENHLQREHPSPHSPESLSLFESAPPSKVLEIVSKKKKRSVNPKPKVTARVKVQRTASKGRMSKSESGGKAANKSCAIEPSSGTVNTSGLEKGVAITSDPGHEKAENSNSMQLNRRPKRQAAANFSVPEKLLPRMRRTKAVLKEVPVVAESQEEVERRVLVEAESAEENSDSDVELDEDDYENLQEDSKKDPDFSPPAKRTRSSNNNNKASQQKEPNLSKNLDNGTVIDSIPDNFTSVKLKASHSVPSSNVADLEPVEVSKQEADDETNKVQESKTVKRSSQWKRKCQQCDYSAPNQRRLDNHVERVHGSRATVYACTVCAFECMWSKSFFEHMKKHFKGPPFTCDFEGCGWQTERIQVLLIHRRNHVDERSYKCPQCSAKFRTRNNLIAHFKCHADNKNHECPICHRRFKMKNTMQQHMVTHSDARPYLCDTCGFSTKFQSHLISHKRIHTGEVFTCNFINCKYSSPKRSQLKAHMRSHLNIRHHTCHICQKSFVEKSHLVRHVKIHQDERPHKCDQCEYSSTRIDKVNEHRRKYHGEEAAKSKRQYKYAPRGKNRVTKMEKKPSALPSSLTTPHAPIVIPGRPIRPKAKEVNPMRPIQMKSGQLAPVQVRPIELKPVQIKPSIAALVSAAAELEQGLEHQNNANQSKGAHTKGRGVKSKAEGKVGNIQVGLAFNGEILVKDEEPENSTRLVMDLEEADPDPEKSGTSDHQRTVKDNPGQVPNTNAAVVSGSKRGVKAKLKAVQNSSSLGTTGQQTHYQPPHSHTSAALLQQLAASAAFDGQHPYPHSTMNLPPGATLLPHTATPDVQEASQILMSARQQHSAAAVSAADSLASLSRGFGLPAGEIPSSETSASEGITQAAKQQQAVSNTPQQLPVQPHPSQPTAPPLPNDCGGLKAFFHIVR